MLFHVSHEAQAFVLSIKGWVGKEGAVMGLSPNHSLITAAIMLP